VKLTGELRLFAVLIKVFEDIDLNEQHAAAAR
jgi:hypothetical protein